MHRNVMDNGRGSYWDNKNLYYLAWADKGNYKEVILKRYTNKCIHESYAHNWYVNL